MRRAGRINRFKANVAWVVLCVHLFGMLVTGVLHPLYHAHSPSYSCYSEAVSSCSDETNNFFPADKDTPHAQTATGHSCMLCQSKVACEFLFEEYRDNAPFTVACSHCGGYLTENYSFNSTNHKRSRAPPVLC